MAAGENVENILNGGAARRGDDADSPGKRGQRFLACGGEEALGGELGLELLEGDLEGSGAHRLHVFGEQLHFAASLVHRDASASDDLHPVLRTEAQQAGLGTKHDDAELRVAVLQGEVEMAAFGGTIVGDFALNPDIGKSFFEVGADGGDQFPHGINAARGYFGGKLEGKLRIAHEESLAGEGRSRGGCVYRSLLRSFFASSRDGSSFNAISISLRAALRLPSFSKTIPSRQCAIARVGARPSLGWVR